MLEINYSQKRSSKGERLNVFEYWVIPDPRTQRRCGPSLWAAMLCNAAALAAGESEWEAEIDGTAWSQKTFPHQVRCLRWLNEQYDALGADSRDRVDAALKGTGCEMLIGLN